MNLYDRIPNNVNLSEDKRLQRALEKWLPNYLDWWHDMGPDGFQDKDVWLRTAVDVGSEGWAHFDYVKMPDYRWGIFLEPAQPDAKVGFGDSFGAPAYQEVPGEFRNSLRRIIVTQGDTEPASVEQQRLLGHTCPRILEAFNQPCDDWLNFFAFTMFTDRDGKYQLSALAESGFEPLARTCKFMLTEEAHHMFVGDTGLSRVVRRTAQLMKQSKSDDVRPVGGIPLDIIQKYINFWFSYSLDLFGGEISSNSADFFAAGLKGRFKEQEQYSDHIAGEGVLTLTVVESGKLVPREVPLRNALNEVLRTEYVKDCEKGLARWNKALADEGIGERLFLPNIRFHRHVGEYAGHQFDLQGNLISPEEFENRKGEWLPSIEDREYVRGLMHPVTEPGKIANWIAPPTSGIKGKPFEFEYVRL